jgi:hypothetical protein
MGVVEGFPGSGGGGRAAAAMIIAGIPFSSDHPNFFALPV